jgi:hypothetical protein
MSLSYYRTSAPSAWGTSNYRFGQPPEPHFRPQPTWGGQDFYQAHALDPDPALYHRIREGRYDAEGVGLREARHWHKHAYGGFNDVRNLSSREMGHAAAYEAYRIWIHNRNISDLRSDGGQRREAFMALAVAEVSHIFPTGQVHNERRKFREACETAAATASTIFHTLDDDGYSSGSHLSPSSFNRSGSTSSDDFSDDLYAFDERAMPRGSHRHRRRNSSVSFSSRPMMVPQNVSPYQQASSMPIPIGQPSSYGGSPYQSGSSPYSNSPPFLGASSYPQQYPTSVPGVPVLGSSYDPNQGALYQNPPGSYPQQAYTQQAYTQQTYPQQAYPQQAYPQQTYIQAQPGMNQAVPVTPGSTIVIQQPSSRSSHSKRHHRHRSSSRRRSHSEAVYPVY